ncbi:2-oxo-4-hydroxy-4-carboxy-5-ureidoimidazoline decarboxylase [Cryobacterium roopkundense]|uniref:2-oxo-4-hydroxy-4-carboxy-5-ureidoimidazoline decarboxylase n=1 Tax=Cryobacterium roopkundense TaxID=1001240 RepID=A0A7W8ZV37_9MICO|nr:2-oxo-4-hydroxy-4-carboxy-5-ureidoimidazoline decarboxylase [Cryobacterium roopkundense]MBB5640786.1 2-oxo-4-hydroxy-4-carboxy-5-ureidoimidazoline decarboxylase [Cryobacterium roopkundense]
MKTLPNTELREWLGSCLAVPRWIDDVMARAPFASTAALLLAAREAATPLSRAEVDEALAGHPRIGDAPRGDSQAARFSRGEQRSADAHDEALAAAIAEGNRAYEQKFDRVFLIRAAGRSRTQILNELNRRLQLHDEAEVRIVESELRDIALLRLASLAGKASE